MKKILSVLFLAILLSSGFATAKVYFEPQWEEFAPQYALNPDSLKNYKKPYQNYWNARLKRFEERKSFCNQQVGKEECYKELRELERYLTTLYVARTVQGSQYGVGPIPIDEIPGYEK